MTLIISKFYVLLLIICTIITSILIDKNLPYFPIEISRTGATGFANFIFSWGTIPLLFTTYLENGYSTRLTLMLVSLIIITFNDDYKYLIRHQIGVLILFLSFLYNIMSEYDIEKLI